MNKLLISLLSLVGASAVGTGSYFLLRENNYEKSKEKAVSQESSTGAKAVTPGANSTGSGESSKNKGVDTPSSSSSQTPDSQQGARQ